MTSVRKLLKTREMENALFGASVKLCEAERGWGAVRRARPDEIMGKGTAEC